MHYASSVFEGERAYNGKIFKSLEHSERFKKSANLIDFEIPYSVEEIEKAKYQALKENGLTDAYVRAFAWRGAGEDMGVASSRNPVRVAVAVWSWGNYYGDAKFKGAKLDIAKWRRPDPATAPSQAKAAGLYMIATMSKHSAEDKGCSDAMMFDYRGYVAEGTGANIFFIKDNEIHTPIPDCFLNGITRQTVIEMLSNQGFEIIERHIEPNEIANYEEAFLTGTAAEITPIQSIDDIKFNTGDSTKNFKFMQDYHNLVRS